MVPVLTAAEMRDADRRTIEELGLPGAVLMENAGAAVARAIRDRFPDAKRPAVLCGKGNNGGDGFVAGRPGPGRAPLVAVDIPSGLSSDNGETSWPTLTAQLTVTFAAPKYGHVLPPACERVGELVVADIGIPRALLEGARLWRLEAGDAARVFPPREPGAHKGSFGHVLVVAGSVGTTGAALLAATAP